MCVGAFLCVGDGFAISNKSQGDFRVTLWWLRVTFAFVSVFCIVVSGTIKLLRCVCLLGQFCLFGHEFAFNNKS